MRKLFLFLFILSFAIAQEAADPPSRAARLGYINGTVSFQPGGVDDWVPAEPNRPMTTGDRLWTEEGSRAEMNLGSAAFRLNSRTNFTFLNLDDKTVQIQVSLGTLNVRLRRLAEDETVEIDTPQAAFTLLRPGDYRIDVNEAGDATIVTVRGGDAEATANGQSFAVHTRDQVRITAIEGSEPVFDRRLAPPSDPFDNFCQDRDRREDLSPSGKYVSRDMPGYADLDANGTWGNNPDYGPVWIPSTVPAGWSPYHYGHWAWIGLWGWTWVDDAPWGYAPFHYGRWVFVGTSWGWIPGPIGPRPVYAPAMVVFVGPARFGVSGGTVLGGVGWFPLGPREVFVPAYSVSAVYRTRVNVTNTVVTEAAVRNVYAGGGAVYANQRVSGAVVMVHADAMVGGRPIGEAAVRMSPGAAANLTVVRATPIAPERAAVLGGRTPIAGGHLPPPAVMNRSMVARVAPPPAPVPFSRQQAALRANPGRPLDAEAVRNLQASQPSARTNIRPVSAPNRVNSVESRPGAALANSSPKTEVTSEPSARTNPPATEKSERRNAERKTSKPAKKTEKEK